MPDIREKLFTLIGQVQDEGKDYSDCFVKGDKPITIENHNLVDYLISNGVTIQNNGRWISKEHDDGFGKYSLYHCSECDNPSAKERKFCAECGAKMDGGTAGG